MKIVMDESLRDVVERTYEGRRLGRNRGIAAQELVFADILCELESNGDAMRYLDRNGRLGWRATTKLEDYISDLKRDAEAELESESESD